jgi:hypothetical protein
MCHFQIFPSPAEVILRICRKHKMRNLTSNNPKNYEEHNIDLQRNRIRNQNFVDLMLNYKTF